MSASTIKITFTANLPLGAQLGFDVVDDGGFFGFPSSNTFIYNWVTLRSASGQVTLGTPTSNVGERAAINFMTAFMLDYGGSYTVTRVLNAVTIKAENLYSLKQFYVNGTLAPYTNHPSIQFDINNATSSQIVVESLTFGQAAANFCQKVKVNVATNNLAVNILQPFQLSGNTDNPFSFEWNRGQTFILSLQQSSGYIINQTVTTPALLNAANFSLIINNSPNGATVTINNANSAGLDLQYSLDNSTWQTGNVYSALAADDYTLYIKDQFGCSTSLPFTVNEFGIYNPFFYISKSNPIRYAQRVIWGDSANYKTDENTLSCEVDVKLAYEEIQQFQSADIVATQFKSNYSLNKVTVVKANGTDVIPVTKISSNIGVKDKRDAVKFNYGNGMTGIYFQSGNIYDFNSNAIVEPYALNGSLPYWARIGNYVIIGSAWFLIEDIIFDEIRNCDAIIFNGMYNGADTPIIVGSIFNFQPYEVYEFGIDMLTYLDQNISVKIEATDPMFAPITYLSESINVKVRQENTVEIRYWNSTNTDVYYSGKLEFKMRQLIQKVSGIPEQKQETNKTDTNVYLTNGDVYEGDEFLFEPVTKGIMQMMVRALSHDNVYINEVGYVKNDSVDVDGPLEQSNLYVVKAKMIKNGNVYNSQASGTGNQIFNGGNLNVPGLVDYGGGFVNY